MHRSFSLRRHRSQPQIQKSSNVPTIEELGIGQATPLNGSEVSRGLSKRLLRHFHSRRHTRSSSDTKTDTNSDLFSSGNANKLPTRSISRREKLVHVIANPDTLFKHDESDRELDSRQENTQTKDIMFYLPSNQF
jgi:hypothetical protein